MIAAAGLTACSDYEAPDITTESAITIVSRDTDFPASASTGSIKFKSNGPVTVTSDKEWITASVDGDVINIAVEPNTAVEGRAGNIIVKSGDAMDEISVVQAGLIFKHDEIGTIDIEADAWSHEYKADATLPVEISSDAEWLKGSINEGVLTISADRNTKLQPRSGVLTLKVGDLTDEITVNQGPLTFPLLKVSAIKQNDDAKTYTYEFPSDVEVKFHSNATWIHGSFENEIVTITVDANNDGHIRSGDLSYSLEGAAGTISVEQYQFDKDIAGEYMFAYTNSTTGKLNYFNSILTGTESDCSIDIPALGFSIPVTYDDETASIKIIAGSYIGDYSSYKAHITLWDTEKGYLSYHNSVSMDAYFEYYVEEDGTGITDATFEDNGSFSGYKVSAIRFEAFTSMTLSSDTRVGSLLSMIDPFLMRIHSAPATATQTAKRQNKTSKLSTNAVPAGLSSLSPIVKDNLRTR